jgi:hypothetical protein
LETSVLVDTAATEKTRLGAAQTLELELWQTPDPDDKLDFQILTVLWNALAPAPPDLQNYLGEALYRLVIGKLVSSAAITSDRQRAFRHNLVIQSEAQTLKALEDWGRRDNSRNEALRLREWLQQ